MPVSLGKVPTKAQLTSASRRLALAGQLASGRRRRSAMVLTRPAPPAALVPVAHPTVMQADFHIQFGNRQPAVLVRRDRKVRAAVVPMHEHLLLSRSHTENAAGSSCTSARSHHHVIDSMKCSNDKRRRYASASQSQRAFCIAAADWKESSCERSKLHHSPCEPRAASRQQRRHHVPGHVGEPEITALVAIRKAQVVEAEQV